MFENLLKKIATQLLEQNIPYMIIGGQAVLVHGEPRLTKDIDVTLGIGANEWRRMEQVIQESGWQYLTSDVEDFVKETMVLPVKDKESGIRIDFIFSLSPYERQAIGKAIDIDLGGVAIKYAALEDVVIHKIVASRPRDIEDAKSVLLKNPGYDKEYIREWLSEFDKSLEENFTESFDYIEEQIKQES
ncbi:MAG: nucleotidyl transferase AbiEii/AbiGii toxin family protein [Candidatus Aminicenantaceae bacterium]